MAKKGTQTGQIKRVTEDSLTLKPGPRIQHGGYSYLRTGKMPKDKAAIERYLTWLRMTYAQDIAGTEDNMTAGQTILLNKLIMLEGLCRCIETTAAAITEATSKLHDMPHKWSSYINSITKICGMLGIERNEDTRRVPSADEMSEIIIAEAKRGKNGR